MNTQGLESVRYYVHHLPYNIDVSLHRLHNTPSTPKSDCTRLHYFDIYHLEPPPPALAPPRVDDDDGGGAPPPDAPPRAALHLPLPAW